ncbi:MAG: hypothetical protein ACPGQL_10965 [Thermoplasmatota archaeon]
MKTYLQVLFNAEGARPSEVHERLQGLGFEATTGAHDFVYNWPNSARVQEVLDFGDQIQAALQGTGCLFEMETI